MNAIEFQNVVAGYLGQFQDDLEKKEVADFLRTNPYGLGFYRMLHFPYAFPTEYGVGDIQVFHTDCCDKYVIYEGKKLFFPSSMSDDAIRENYMSLLIEQDGRSPHCYSSKPKFIPEEGEVVADLGAAEGIWVLSVIERCKKAYLFECDEKWIDALRQTFAPWREKVVIVNKFVGDADDEDYVTLDTYFADKEIDCVKADIEGAEIQMLIGAARTLTEKVSKVLLCAYHNQGDEDAIKVYLKKYDFEEIETTDRYMLFTYLGTKIVPPYIRRALVLGCKKRTSKKLDALCSVDEWDESVIGALRDTAAANDDTDDVVDALYDRYFLFEPLAKALERAGIKDRTIVLGWCGFSKLYGDFELAEGKIAYPPSTHKELLTMYHGITENTPQYIDEIFTRGVGLKT